MTDRMLDVQQVSARLNCHPNHVYRLIQLGRLAAVNLSLSDCRPCWRVSESTLLAFLAARTVANGSH